MNKEQYFLEAINAGEPNADLVYADWLEEQGRPEADEVRDPIVVVSRDWSFSQYYSESRSWSWSHFFSRSKSRNWLRSLSRTVSQYSSQCRSRFYYRCWSWHSSRSQSHSHFQSRSCSGFRFGYSPIQTGIKI